MAGQWAGSIAHLGDPLTVDQIRQLPDGAEVVITWSGGNGPWPYRILIDRSGGRRVENGAWPNLLAPHADQRIPLHHVTIGWDQATRAWFESKAPDPPHIIEQWRRLRAPVATSASP